MTFTITKRPGVYVSAPVLGAHIAQHLEETGMTRNHFAKEAGLSTSTVRKVVSGEILKVTAATATAILITCRDTVGLTQLPDHLSIWPLDAAISSYALAADRSVNDLLGTAHMATLMRAKRVGVCRTLWADEMSCHVLGRPLELIYGPTWDTDHLEVS